MFKTDYKFKSIIRNGQTTRCVVRFYEGDITTEPELDLHTNTIKDTTRYRRTKLLRTEDITFDGDLTDNQLRFEMNKKLVQDLLRTPINEQKNA